MSKAKPARKIIRARPVKAAKRHGIVASKTTIELGLLWLPAGAPRKRIVLGVLCFFLGEQFLYCSPLGLID